MARRLFTDTLPAGLTQYRKGSILQAPISSRVYIFLSRRLLHTNDTDTVRISPWAMSPKSCISSTAAVAGTVPFTLSQTPDVQALYIRVESQQYPQEAFRSTVDRRAESFRAYQAYVQAARKALVAGSEQPCLSYQAFLGDYLFYTISLQADPSNEIAGSVTAATSALASTAVMKIVLHFKSPVAAPAPNYGQPNQRGRKCFQNRVLGAHPHRLFRSIIPWGEPTPSCWAGPPSTSGRPAAITSWGS